MTQRERITPGGAIIVATCEAVRVDVDGNQIALWVEKVGGMTLGQKVR